MTYSYRTCSYWLGGVLALALVVPASAQEAPRKIFRGAVEAVDANTLDLNMGIKPYAAAGLGGVNVTYKSSDGGNALAYQLKLGASGPLNDQVSWFGEYRYQQALGDVNVGTPSYPVEYASHSILGGLKLSFGGGGSSGSYTGY